MIGGVTSEKDLENVLDSRFSNDESSNYADEESRNDAENESRHDIENTVHKNYVVSV